MTYPLRAATPADLPEIAIADGRAFGEHLSEEHVAALKGLLDMDRFLLACDGPSIVGITGSFRFSVHVPGGREVPAPGVTWVSVAATHRRRGVLRALLTEQHQQLAAEGMAVSLLTASEGAIYGRFGYGVATRRREVELERRRSVLRPELPDDGGVRFVETPQARTLQPEIYARWAANTPGAVTRDDAHWDWLLSDRPDQRRGGSALFHLVHPDGYVSYRIVDGASGRSARLTGMVAVTEQAHVALWRVLLATDLIDKIETWNRPVDDALPYLLTDPRQVRTTGLGDGMWARVLDVPAALSARTYGAELDVALDVRDELLEGVDVSGRYRLRGGPEGATCTRTDAAPDVTLGVAALGSMLFGDARATTLARAALLDADAALLPRLDHAFGTDRSPQHGTEF